MSKQLPSTEDARKIQCRYIPEWAEWFWEVNAEYAGQERDLGSRAEWAQLWRKIKKLKASMWDGEATSRREDDRTILQEIIGHAFLALISLDEERERAAIPAKVRGNGEPF